MSAEASAGGVFFNLATYDVGGAETSALAWIDALPSVGWRPVGVRVARPGALSAQVAARGLPVVFGSDRRFRDPIATVRDIRAISSFLGRGGVSVIHSTGAKAHMYGAYGSVRHKVPSLWTLNDFPSRSPWMLVSPKLPGKPVAVSNPCADAAVPFLRARPVVVHDPVNTARFEFHAQSRQRLRAEWGIADGDFLVGSVGRLQKQKGILDMLSALAQVHKDSPHVKGVVIGSSLMGLEPEYEAQVHAHARSLGLTDERCRFVPQMADASGVYSAIDVLVHSAIYPEAFCRVIVEAMAAGRWIIATDIGGPRETVTAETGELVPPGRPDLLAKAIASAVADASVTRGAFTAGPSRASEFDVEASVAALARIYQELVSGKARPGRISISGRAKN
jgi:glycosyltransferase involved in cell wall biosynthesis